MSLAWKSWLCVVVQDLQLVKLCSGQNSMILSQQKFYTSLRSGIFSSSVCRCFSHSNSLPGLTYFLLFPQDKGQHRGCYGKKMAEGFVSSTGFFFKKNPQTLPTTGIENLIIWPKKKKTTKKQEQVTVGISRSIFEFLN